MKQKHKSLRQMRKKDARLEGRTSVMIVVQAVDWLCSSVREEKIG